MPTYTFDDGSTITDDAVSGGWVTSSTPATDNGIAGWSSDQREADKLGQFYPGDGQWWEKLALYGATRAIDSHFGPTELDKTKNPAYFAGQNGRTYTAATAVPGSGSGMTGLLLLGLAAVAALVLIK